MTGEAAHIPPAQIAEAKARVPVSSLVQRSVKLTKAGREFAGLCPFHCEKTPSFTVNDDKGFYHCFGCGAHGDQLAWLTDHDGLSFRDAAAVLLADAGMGAVPQGMARRDPVRREAPVREDDDDCVPSIEVARHIWRLRPGPAWRTPVEAWLRVRGVHPEQLGAGQDSPVLEQLRFHARVPTGRWPVGQQPRRFQPAMIATIEAPVLDECAECVVAFKPIGLHVTYLTPDGRAKAGKRKFYGQSQGGGLLLGQWDGDAACIGCDPLAVAEGIETTLAFMAREGIARGAAALSLNNLQGYALRDREGAVALFDAKPDLRRAMLVWPGETRVAIGVDADMKGETRLVRDRPRGAAVKRALSGRERTDLCAAMASAAWRQHGARVMVKRPPMGADFNDVVREPAT